MRPTNRSNLQDSVLILNAVQVVSLPVWPLTRLDNPAGSLHLDTATQELTPVTNIFREYANGTIRGGPSAATKAANIEMLNGFVAKNFEPSDSVWRNYFEGGAIWMLPNTLKPNQYPNVQLRGSKMLSSATMESYTQNSAQCFSCHNTQKVFGKVAGQIKSLPGTNFNLSHILVNEYFRTLAEKSGLKVRNLR